MAKVDSKGNMRGIIGAVSTRVLHGVNIVQSRGVKPKQTANTKKAATAFGYVSRHCKTIRLAIGEVLYKNHDPNFSRRLTATMLKLFNKNTQIPIDQRTFLNTSLQGLVGFDLNANSPFATFCTLPLLAKTVGNNKTVLQLDAFQASDSFIFPAHPSEAQLEFTLIPLAFPLGINTPTETFSIRFTKNEKVAEQIWETSLPSTATFTFMVAELTYFKAINRHKKISINSKDFHPSCIVYIDNGVD
ncbi:hypothetical protein [Myroides sp. DW712]|uniref:hypothetical protein n=1 Tax=Myroides sp. DW712 TaxID=3389800 RepID=UPI00397D4178